MLANKVIFLAVFVLEVGSGIKSQCGHCMCSYHQEKITANCTYRHLQTVPTNLPKNVTHLNLSHNNITFLHNNTFYRYQDIKNLNLSFNKLERLERDIFIGLSSLCILDVHSNILSLNNRTYPAGLFRNQKQLEVLLIHNNSDVEGSTASALMYPDMTFSDLTSLKLLQIDGLRFPIFGEGFETLKNLNVLILSESSGGNCAIKKLLNNTFVSLQSVRFLEVSGCQLREIESLCFEPLQHLLTLDLSNNVDLTIPTIGKGLFGTVNSSLEVLKMNNVYRRRGPGIVITTEDVKYLTTPSLKELHLDGNKIELLELNVLTSLPKGIQGISAKNNNFNFGLYMFELSYLRELKWLDASFQDQSHVTPFSVGKNDVKYKSDLIQMIETESFDSLEIYIRQKGEAFMTPHAKVEDIPSKYYRSTWHTVNLNGWSGNFTILVPPNLTFFKLNNSKMKYELPRSNFSQNNLTTLDLSNNFFVRWVGPIIGLGNLEYADLSHNYCDYIDDDFAKYFLSLKVVNASSNYLGFSLTDHTIGNLTLLEYLDFSDNKISQLPRQIFRNNRNMKYLNLSHNTLKTWDTSIGHLMNLTVLDISQNLLEGIPSPLRAQLDNISSIKRIHLRGNTLKCDCDHLPFLKWMETRLHVFDFPYICKLSGENWKLTNVTLITLVLKLEKDCASYIGVMIGCLTVVVLILSVSIWGVLYRYRWKLRYLYYMTRRRYRGYERAELDQFEFDAFISYADEDRWLVINDMRQRMEEVEGLRLCIHHRNFLPGQAIADNIVNAVRASRNTVAILSKNFLASNWCNYEVEMARMESVHTGRHTLIVVLLEDVPMGSLNCDLQEMMKQNTYIEYTTDQHGQEVFWQNLTRAISATGDNN